MQCEKRDRRKSCSSGDVECQWDQTHYRQMHSWENSGTKTRWKSKSWKKMIPSDESPKWESAHGAHPESTLDPYSEEIRSSCCCGVNLPRFRSTCPFRRKSHCQSGKKKKRSAPSDHLQAAMNHFYPDGSGLFWDEKTSSMGHEGSLNGLISEKMAEGRKEPLKHSFECIGVMRWLLKVVHRLPLSSCQGWNGDSCSAMILLHYY